MNYQYNNHYEMKLNLMDTLTDWKEWTYNLTGLVGGNNVISTTTDLLKYDQALYSGILLKPETLEEAFTPTKLNNGENNRAINNTSCGLGWFIFNDTSRGKIVWHSGSNPGVSTLLVRNITKKQTYIILQNVACPQNVYFDILDIINGKPVRYKKSIGFIYGADLWNKDINYAFAHLNQLKDDTLNYSLTEGEMNRIGLEFSRTKYQDLSLEAYKITTLLFPNSWMAYADYAHVLSNKAEGKDAAIMMYKRSLQINSENKDVKLKLTDLLNRK